MPITNDTRMKMYMCLDFITAENTRSFYKMQGLGNHFIIIDARTLPFQPSAETIMKLCSINAGIGAEQLIVIEPPTMAKAYARVRIYNSDGLEAEACGNATRCVARLLMDANGSINIRLEIAMQLVVCHKQETLFLVEMGQVTFDWQSIPLTSPIKDFFPGFVTMAANISNPHVVVFIPSLDQLSTDERITIGTTIQAHPALPESANIGFAEVVSPNQINLQVFERPGVLTQACGTGACAAVASAHKLDYLEADTVVVQMPGGCLSIGCDQAFNVTMTGAAEYCYEGKFLESQYA